MSKDKCPPQDKPQSEKKRLGLTLEDHILRSAIPPFEILRRRGNQEPVWVRRGKKYPQKRALQIVEGGEEGE